jgi:hypothetical protein
MFSSCFRHALLVFCFLSAMDGHFHSAVLKTSPRAEESFEVSKGPRRKRLRCWQEETAGQSARQAEKAADS